MSNQEINVDPNKIKPIKRMLEPKTEKEVRGFLSQLNCIAKFISQLMHTYKLTFQLLQKIQLGKWDKACLQAFDRIKAYL